MEFPTVRDIVAQHDIIITRYGGSPGILSLETVRSAIERMEWGPFEGEGDVFERAALLLRGIAQDHPFWDGNKRTAYQATRSFVEANGHRLLAPQEAVVEAMLAVAQGQWEVAGIAAWMRRQSKPLSGGEEE